MRPGSVTRIASRVAIEVEKEGKLDRSAAATSVAVPRAIAGAAALGVHINGIVAICSRIRDHLADLGKHRGRARRPRRTRGRVSEISQIADGTAYLAVGSGVFIAGSGITGAANARVPAI